MVVIVWFTRSCLYCLFFCLLYERFTIVRGGCGKYDIETQTCCRGKIYQGANLSCCDTQVYDRNIQTCCKNILHVGGNLTCCNLYAYDPSSHTCCNGSLFVGGEQSCQNVTHECGIGEIVVVGCYKYCTCAESLAGAKIPENCGQVCEDCMGSRGEMVGCAPKCECDVNNGYVRLKNKTTSCVHWKKCRRHRDLYHNFFNSSKKGRE